MTFLYWAIILFFVLISFFFAVVADFFFFLGFFFIYIEKNLLPVCLSLFFSVLVVGNCVIRTSARKWSNLFKVNHFLALAKKYNCQLFCFFVVANIFGWFVSSSSTISIKLSYEIVLFLWLLSMTDGRYILFFKFI